MNASFKILILLLHFFCVCARNMYGDETDSSEQNKPNPEPPVMCKGLELMKVSHKLIHTVPVLSNITRVVEKLSLNRLLNTTVHC